MYVWALYGGRHTKHTYANAQATILTQANTHGCTVGTQCDAALRTFAREGTMSERDASRTSGTHTLHTVVEPDTHTTTTVCLWCRKMKLIFEWTNRGVFCFRHRPRKSHPNPYIKYTIWQTEWMCTLSREHRVNRMHKQSQPTDNGKHLFQAIISFSSGRPSISWWCIAGTRNGTVRVLACVDKDSRSFLANILAVCGLWSSVSVSCYILWWRVFQVVIVFECCLYISVKTGRVKLHGNEMKIISQILKDSPLLLVFKILHHCYTRISATDRTFFICLFCRIGRTASDTPKADGRRVKKKSTFALRSAYTSCHYTFKKTCITCCLVDLAYEYLCASVSVYMLEWLRMMTHT